VTSFLARRAVQSVVLLFLVSSGVFFLVHLTPGGPEAALVQNPRIGAAEQQRERERFGLNEPLPGQYVKWLTNATRLDFGRSYFYGRPATDIVAERLGPTVQLGALSYAVALLGIPLGIWAALNHGRAPDILVRLLATAGHAVPSWWLALSSIVLFSTLTGWFPNGQGQGGPGEWLKYIWLPALVLGLGGMVTFTRYTRAGILDALNEDYVRTAHAKGLPHHTVITDHVLRAALLPLVTLLGGVLPALVSGALVTEYVFGWPGIGRLFYEAASSRDYPIVLAVLTMLSFATILGTLLADLSYGIVDPRVRYT
jgi:peptide/nickel transport system permease protein